MNLFSRFFTEESDPGYTQDQHQQADAILAWANMAYFGEFILWLEREASKPLTLGDHMAMVQTAVRANTLREVRDHMVRVIAWAKAVKQSQESESA